MEKEKVIRVLCVAPEKKLTIVTLENELHSLQDAVSVEAGERGLIELIGVENGVDIMLNEEGKLLGLPLNRRFGNDILVGAFYVVGVDGEHLASLPGAMVEKYRKVFDEVPEFGDVDMDDLIKFEFFGF